MWTKRHKILHTRTEALADHKSDFRTVDIRVLAISCQGVFRVVVQTLYRLGAQKRPHCGPYVYHSLHPQTHESRNKPLSYGMWFLSRHLNQTQQLLHSNVQCRRPPIVKPESCLLQHGHRLPSFCRSVEKLDFCKNMLERLNGRDRWHTKFGIKVVRESEIGKN